MTRTVAALYDSRDEAERVRSRLVSALSVKSPPRIIGKDTVGAIDGMKFAPKDAQSYRDGLRNGAYLLVAQVPGTSSAKQIVELLEVPQAVAVHLASPPPVAQTRSAPGWWPGTSTTAKLSLMRRVAKSWPSA